MTAFLQIHLVSVCANSTGNRLLWSGQVLGIASQIRIANIDKAKCFPSYAVVAVRPSNVEQTVPNCVGSLSSGDNSKSDKFIGTPVAGSRATSGHPGEKLHKMAEQTQLTLEGRVSVPKCPPAAATIAPSLLWGWASSESNRNPFLFLLHCILVLYQKSEQHCSH